jgi:hypothetical protein
MSDATLGGYLDLHSRPPAFEGSDGRPYSVEIWVDEAPDEDGTYGASLLFVRWAPAADRPEGHLETECLVRAQSATEARGALRDMTLHQIKDHLDRLIETGRGIPNW